MRITEISFFKCLIFLDCFYSYSIAGFCWFVNNYFKKLWRKLQWLQSQNIMLSRLKLPSLHLSMFSFSIPPLFVDEYYILSRKRNQVKKVICLLFVSWMRPYAICIRENLMFSRCCDISSFLFFSHIFFVAYMCCLGPLSILYSRWYIILCYSISQDFALLSRITHSHRAIEP